MNIALIGYGVENAGAYRYLSRKYPQAAFTVYDEQASPQLDLPEDVAFVGSLSQFDVTADLLVRTPGIAPYKIQTDSPVTTATQIFFEQCHAPIIGVTGSKGKGTTSSLVASILEAAGKRVHLVGNIGTPALDALDAVQPEDIVVYELSSFQLWDVKKSPHVAVVLMIEPEHLDVHKDLDDYVNAKANITRFQTPEDLLVYRADNRYTQQVANTSVAAKITFPDESHAHVTDGTFYYGDQALCATSELQLPGAHNLDNACAAITATWPWVQDPDTVAKGLRSFGGLPHRLKLVREVDGVSYYDDSIATTPGSAIAAIHAFMQPKVLILGGSSKGADFAELAQEAKRGNVKHVLLIGQEADNIQRALEAAGYTHITPLGTNIGMTEIVKRAANEAQAGDIVILSPSCASFGMFKNYVDRGNQFIESVQAL